jgi:hypothetical protein
MLVFDGSIYNTACHRASKLVCCGRASFHPVSRPLHQVTHFAMPTFDPNAGGPMKYQHNFTRIVRA